jgi:hypothetical protein
MTERDREYFRICREEIEASVREILSPPVAQNA